MQKVHWRSTLVFWPDPTALVAYNGKGNFGHGPVSRRQSLTTPCVKHLLYAKPKLFMAKYLRPTLQYFTILFGE